MTHYEAEEILQKLGVSTPTLYRWMKRENSTFPSPVKKDGKRVLWSSKDVDEWIAKNPPKPSARRSSSFSIEMRWEDVLVAMLKKPIFHEVKSRTVKMHPMDNVKKFERLSDGQVKLLFERETDAFTFHLEYAGSADTK